MSWSINTDLKYCRHIAKQTKGGKITAVHLWSVQLRGQASEQELIGKLNFVHKSSGKGVANELRGERPLPGQVILKIDKSRSAAQRFPTMERVGVHAL